MVLVHDDLKSVLHAKFIYISGNTRTSSTHYYQVYVNMYVQIILHVHIYFNSI